jgi:prepilin-type N-terminal cleavage/methylation domain-containing protein
MMRIQQSLRGATLTELLISIAVLSIVSGIAIPTYQSYVVRNDLQIAVEQAKSALVRAQLRAQSGDSASAWGVRADEGMVYKGDAYDDRDVTFDEFYILPQGVSVSGILDVSFSPLYGVPNIEGDIIFTSVDGQSVEVKIGVALDGPSQESSSATSSIESSQSSSKKKKKHHDDDDDSDDDSDDDE